MNHFGVRTRTRQAQSESYWRRPSPRPWFLFYERQSEVTLVLPRVGRLYSGETALRLHPTRHWSCTDGKITGPDRQAGSSSFFRCACITVAAYMCSVSPHNAECVSLLFLFLAAAARGGPAPARTRTPWTTAWPPWCSCDSRAAQSRRGCPPTPLVSGSIYTSIGTPPSPSFQISLSPSFFHSDLHRSVILRDHPETGHRSSAALCVVLGTKICKGRMSAGGPSAAMGYFRR